MGDHVLNIEAQRSESYQLATDQVSGFMPSKDGEDESENSNMAG